MRYADNILKSFATAVSIITSTIVSMYAFEFKVSKLFVIGGILVFIAIRLYSQEPPKASAPKVDESRVDEAAVEMLPKGRSTSATLPLQRPGV